MMELDFDYWAARDKGYSDDDILNGMQRAGKLDFDLKAARAAGYSSSDIMQGLLGTQMQRQAAPPAPEPSSLLRRAGDVGVSLLRGAIALPETAVGLADIVTGGAAGRGAEAIGFRPREAKESLAELYSPEQQAATRKVQQAEGFLDTAGAMLSNPSTIVQTAAESAPSMLGGGVIGRGVAALAPRIAPAIAGAIGEGVVGAGQAAEQIRQQQPGGDLTAGQAGAALASGVGTGVFGAIGGRIAQKLGIADIDTALVQAGTQMTSKGVARRILEGGISEGVMEELPQSVQEQIWQNAAMDKPLLEGVPQSAAQGLLVGGLFGGIAGGALPGRAPAVAPEPELPVPQLGYAPDPYISFPDGSVGKQSDAENFINSLPEDQRIAARSRLYGYQEEVKTEQDVLAAQSVDEAIRIADRATSEASPEFQAQRHADIDAAWNQYLADITNQREAEFLAAEDARRAAETPGLLEQVADQQIEQAAAITEAQGFGQPEPTAMQLAMQRAMEQQAPGAPAAPAPVAVAPEQRTADDVNRARDILTAAGVTGNERMAALRSIRTGENTLDDLIDAHPPKAANVANRPQAALPGAQLRIPGAEVPAPVQQVSAPARAPGQEAIAAAGLPSAERLGVPVPPAAVGAGTAGRPVAELKGVAGPRIDNEWVQFAPESRTLNVPRERMPQVKAEHRGAMVNFLAARGIPHTEAQEVAPESLNPTQREFSEKKVRQAQEYQGGDRSILVSDDNYVVDGHHQWLAKLAAGEPVKVIRLDAPIETVLREVAEFPSAEVSRGAPTQGERNAPRKISQQGRIQEERGEGGRVGQAAEAGRGDRVQRAARGEEGQSARTTAQEEVAPSVRHGREEEMARLRAAREERLAAQRAKPKSEAETQTEQKYARQEAEIARAKEAAEARRAAREGGEEPLKSVAQKQTETEAFKRWFGDSKVVDENGAPLVVYHGSPDLRFMNEDGVFKSQREKLGFGRDEAAHWFAAAPSTARSYADPRRAFDYQNAEEGVIPAYLKMENPLIVDGKGQKWRDAQKSGKTSDIIKEARDGGYDGVIIRNVRDDYQTGVVKGERPTDTYVVFSSKQIKSADRNTGAFDPENADIRASQAAARGGMTVADVTKATARLRAKWLGFNRLNIVQSVADLPGDLAQRAKADQNTEALFDPRTNAVYLIADNLSSPERAAFVAAHEVIGHGGLTMLRDKSVTEALKFASGNRLVKELAVAIQDDRDGIAAHVAVEEAIAELSAALETGDYAGLEQRYGVTIPDSAKSGLKATIARLFDAIKRFIASVTGQPVERVSDAEVRDLLRQQQAAVEGRQPSKEAPARAPIAAPAMASEAPANGAKEFEQEMEAKYPGIRLDLLERRNGDLHLSRIVVPMDQREIGIGTRFMEDLTAYADKTGQRIVLTPSSDFGGNAKRLTDFYKRFGFVENKGRNRDFSTTESMYRDPESAPMQSRAPKQPATPEEVIPDWAKGLTAEQKSALRKSGAIYSEKTWRQKVDEMRDGALKKLQYGILDQFAPIKDMLGKTPYILARMAKNADGTLESLMLYGRPHLDADGGMLVDTTKKGFVETMQQLQGEHDRFFSWMAGRRAEQLKKEGRENLFTDEDISSLSTLNQGKMKDGSSREAAYLKAQKDVAELNKSVLDIAEQSGLIDPESRKVWASDFYVPFYRVMEEGITGPSVKSGLVNQKSIKKLKGGKNNLGDLTQNMLMNWSTLLTASAKNRAAKATLDAAENIGAAIEAPEATIRDMAKSTGNRAVSYMENGKNRWFTVEDPHLLQAISSLEFSGYNNQAMKVMTAFKNYLTMAVTSMPGFKVRNLIRDSLSSIAVAPTGFNPVKNIKNGYSVLRDNDIRANLIAGGGVFRFGTFLDGNRGEYAKQLIDEGVPADTILDTSAKMNKFLRKLWKGYQEVGDISENVNRAALYKKLRTEGKSHLEASFEARDLMDFGLSGAWAGVRAMNQILPFFNARLQGIYKLGRGYNDDPKRMGSVIGGLTLATIALSMAYKDDDDFKKRTEADRNNYWWFKVGDTAYRIPKPFEVGAAATAVDNLLAQLYDAENTDSKRLMEQMGDIVNAQLAMNPIPQVFRPLIDVYANKDAFSGRPIESLAMQRLRPEDRYTYNTSELARLLGKSGVLVDPVSLVAGTGVKRLSPVQIDSIIKGYFSGVGTLATSAVDGLLHHSVIDRGEALPLTLKQMTSNFAEDLPSNTSRYVDKLYNSAQEIEQSYASYQNALKQGDLAKAREIYEDEGEKIAKYHMIESLKKNEARIGQQIQRVMNDKMMTGEQKEEQIRRYKKLQDQIARQMAMRG